MKSTLNISYQICKLVGNEVVPIENFSYDYLDSKNHFEYEYIANDFRSEREAELFLENLDFSIEEYSYLLYETLTIVKKISIERQR